MKVLVQQKGKLEFNKEAITEYILDENMELKALRFKDGVMKDIRGIHRQHRPQHPMLRTPEGLKKTLNLFFRHSLNEQQIKA